MQPPNSHRAKRPELRAAATIETMSIDDDENVIW
jgi:hypothetical protein